MLINPFSFSCNKMWCKTKSSHKIITFIFTVYLNNTTMEPFINFEIQESKKSNSFIDTAVRRIHTSKSTTAQLPVSRWLWYIWKQNRTLQQTLSRPTLHQVTWFAIIGRETRKRQCHRAVLWACGLFSPSSRRMQCWETLEEKNLLGVLLPSLRPALISKDYLFCYLDIHLFLN